MKCRTSSGVPNRLGLRGPRPKDLSGYDDLIGSKSVRWERDGKQRGEQKKGVIDKKCPG